MTTGPALELAEAIQELHQRTRSLGTMTLRELCDEMHAEVHAHGTIGLLDQAFGELPVPVTSPAGGVPAS